MTKVMLIADQSRENYAELRTLAARISEALGNAEVELASTDNEIEQNAALNVSQLPVIVVDEKAVIVFNPESQHISDVVKQIVA